MDNRYFVCCICGYFAYDGDPVGSICLRCIDHYSARTLLNLKKIKKYAPAATGSPRERPVPLGNIGGRNRSEG